MKRIVDTKSAILSPAKNPFMNVFLRKMIYDHFAAGECAIEVKATIVTMRQMGFKGVILGHAKEVVVDPDARTEGLDAGMDSAGSVDPVVQQWKEGQLETLKMLGPDDFLAIK